MRLRKSKLFYSFSNPRLEILEIAIGTRHGVIRTNEITGSIYTWGDGTYGEIGHHESLLPVEKPTKVPFFEDKKIFKIAAGARHTLTLDNEGNIFAMGDNSED